MKEIVNLPGYDGVDADFIAAILDEVHDIAQELAYINAADLKALDPVNRSYVDMAFAHAIRRAREELTEIMMDIRNMRTPIDPKEKPAYRVLSSKYQRTDLTKS